MDADTLAYDFSFDVTSLLGQDDMLAAQKVSPNDVMRTWNVNNGITLWNLRHNTTMEIARRWLERTSKGINGACVHGWKEHGDQHYLHNALRDAKEAIQYIKALTNEFR